MRATASARSSSKCASRHLERLAGVQVGLRARVRREVVVRPHRGIDQHGARAEALGEMRRVVAAERAADERERRRIARCARPTRRHSRSPSAGRCGRSGMCSGGRVAARQRRDAARSCVRLDARGRAAEAVQVDDRRLRHAAQRQRVAAASRGCRRSRRCSSRARGRRRAPRARSPRPARASRRARGALAPSGASARGRVPAEVRARSRTRGRRRARLPAARPSSRRASSCWSAARARRGCARRRRVRRRPAMRRRDRRRVMREVVVDRDAAHRAAHLHAALARPGSARAPRAPCATRHAGVARRGERGERIHAGCARPCRSPAQRALRLRRRAGSCRRPRSSSRAGARAPRRAPKRSTCVQQPRASTRASAASPPLTMSRPLRGHDAHEMMELRLDRGEIGEDVGVVVFEVVEDRGARPVVHELGALVEERGVVLVGLDHEERRCRSSRADTPKFAGTPPIRKPGLEARVLEDPGEHRRWSSSCRACRRPRAPTCPRSTFSHSHCGPET